MTASPLAAVGGPALAPSRTAPAAVVGSEELLTDAQFVSMVRWVFTARLVCLALAAPSALLGHDLPASVSLILLAATSVVLSRNESLIRTMLRHPLLASLDVTIAVALLVTADAGQPAVLTAVCSALVAGLLFPPRALVPLLVPLALGSLVSSGSLAPRDWTGWLSVIAGLPTLVIAVCIVGAVVRRNVAALVQARHEVADAVAAVGAADERARLARDMHDSVGKSLHGISLGAKALGRAIDRDPQLAGELAKALAQAADQAGLEARALLLSLRAGQDDRPTVEVIGEALRAWEAESGVTTRLSVVRAVDADPTVTHQMQLALNEILHNIAKHAQAHHVEVELSGTPDEIALEVVDDGVGFASADIVDREAAGHFGLRGLRERAEKVGGAVEVSSSPGKGTRVRWTAQRQRRLT